MKNTKFIWWPTKSQSGKWIWLRTATKVWNPEKDTCNMWLCDAPIYVGGWDYI